MSVGKSGIGMSVGGKGLRYSVHSSGRRTSTVGIPGTGVSYSTSSSSKRYKSQAYQRRNELARLEKEKQKLQELEFTKLQVELYENRLEQLKTIHQESVEVVDWEEVYQREAPYASGEVGQNEREAIHKWNAYTQESLTSCLSGVKKRDKFYNII